MHPGAKFVVNSWCPWADAGSVMLSPLQEAAVMHCEDELRTGWPNPTSQFSLPSILGKIPAEKPIDLIGCG